MFLISVALIWTVAAITPGPNTLLAIRYCLTSTRRVAFIAAAGTVTGTLCWGLAGWLGINALFQAAPFTYLALKIGGGLYLVWLGARMLWQVRRPQLSGSIAGKREVIPPVLAYRMGLVTNLANPKSALFVASLFAATMPADAPWPYGIAAIATMMMISSIYYALLIGLMTHHRVASAYLRARRRIDLVVGTIFVGFGSRLLFSGR